MRSVSVRSRVILCFTALWWVSSGVFAAEAPRKNYPLTVDPVSPVTREHHIRIEGHAAPKQQVTIAGGASPAQARADSHGEFHAELSLTRNQTNTLQVSTIEPAATVSVTIMQDSTAPQLAIDSPREDALVYKPHMHITGHVTDNLSGIAAVSCGHSPATMSGTQFSCDMPVGDTGGHRIKVWSSDAAGNVAVAHRRVVSGPQLSGGDAHTVTATADLNGDRHIDVVRTDFLAGEVVIRLGNGDGTFQAEKRVRVGPYPSSLALADINRDGILDLVTTHYTGAEVAIQYGQPDGNYVQGPRLRVGLWPSAIAVADMDNDGKLDLITAHLHEGGIVRVHLAGADGGFESATTVEVGKAPHALAVGDVFGDDKLDVVVANYLSNDVSLLRGRGNGHFHSERRIDLNASAVGPTAIALADLDRDGALDIATANFGSNDVTVLNGIGQGRFKTPQAFAAAPQPIAVAALEVTGDDKLDLVTGNLGSSAVSVLPGQAGGMYGGIEPLRSSAPIVRPLPARVDPTNIVIPDPTTPAIVQPADMPSALFPVARAPAAGLPTPADRIGMSFGNGTSNYPFLMGPDGMSYTPLIAMGRAGVKWIRLEGDANYFLPGSILTMQGISKTVDDLIAHGYNVHIVVSDLRTPYPADFPSDQFLSDLAKFAGDLARATNRPGRVVYEVWNEPNLLGVFWPLKRPGVNEAALYARLLARTTEAIHTAAPGSMVMAGGIFSYFDSYVTDMLVEYNRQLVNHPLALVDQFALHPYPVDFDILNHFRSDLKAGGMGALPVNVSEIGGWWGSREWVGAWNAGNLLRAVEDDVPYINFWGALSYPGDESVLGGFMDPSQSQFSSCMASVYGSIPNTPGYMCHPSMYMLSTFNRVAQGRTYQGALFDVRTHSQPGWVQGDPLSGLRALKFESGDDIVIAAYTLDRTRATVAGSGRRYSIAFPEKPIYVSTFSGQDVGAPDADGRYWITHDRGPLYFFFSKSGQVPTETVSAQAVCADGSLPRRGRLQLWHTAWPYNGPSSVLDWKTPGVSDAGTLMTVSDPLPLFISNMYVYAEVADGSGRTLEVRSGVQTQGGPGAPKVVINKFFNPLTPMVELAGPSVGSALYRVEYLALPEWCTP